jgi:hypothetical protein
MVQQKQKDLTQAAAAPEFLDVVNSLESVAVSSSLAEAELAPSTSYPSFLEDWNDGATRQIGRGPWTQPDVFNLLDACQMVSDLTQVGKAYDWLLSKGFLPNFGKETNRGTLSFLKSLCSVQLSFTQLSSARLSLVQFRAVGSAEMNNFQPAAFERQYVVSWVQEQK